jgi:hypothetical protein
MKIKSAPLNEETRPVIDYANLPELSRDGIKAEGNNHFLTRSLFLETSLTPEDKARALWTLTEREVYAYGRWYPSAWMAYIHAPDEYRALRRICGNVRQWGFVKAMFVSLSRVNILEGWVNEQELLQKSIVREALQKTVVEGAGGAVAAAKLLLQMQGSEVKGPGRPRKPKPKEESKDEGVKADLGRVVNFR